MQYKRISADCHLDLPWLPGELFVSEAKRELQDRMPYVEDSPDGPQWVTRAGIKMGLVGGVGSVGGKVVPGQNYRVDKMAETGLYEDGKKGVQRPGDPDQRIKDMDRDGVDAEIIFGILGVASRVRDHEAANEMLRIYNDWLKGFCSHYPDRQIGLACLPYGDIDAAVKENLPRRQARPQRARALLLVGYGADVAPGVGTLMESRQRRANSTALPHLPRDAGECARQPRGRASPQGPVHLRCRLPDEFDQYHCCDHWRRRPRTLPKPAHRFGRKRYRLAPYALDRIDFEFEDRFRDLMRLKPSEYWRRQCRATFQFDRIGAKLVEDIGVETLMWGSDYPHPDGVWPESSKYIEEQFAGLSPEVIHKITCENAGKFYGLIN
jgi:uncharacterized protein